MSKKEEKVEAPPPDARVLWVQAKLAKACVPALARPPPAAAVEARAHHAGAGLQRRPLPRPSRPRAHAPPLEPASAPPPRSFEGVIKADKFVRTQRL